MGVSPARRDGRGKPSDSSLGKRITETHSSLPKACAQDAGQSAHKKSDLRPPRLLLALVVLRVFRASVAKSLSSHFGNFWLLKFFRPSFFSLLSAATALSLN